MHPLNSVVNCDTCAYKQSCGGLIDASSFFWGCYYECATSCDSDRCDYTCPYNHKHHERLFAERLDEIEGTFNVSAINLKAPKIGLPHYVPKIHNRSSRSRCLRWPMVAIPVRALLSKKGRKWVCRFHDPSQLRQHFRLSRQTPYIISCVSHDGDIEVVWDELMYEQFAQKVARLKPAAVIVPNFSFFNEVPRTHTIYNRKRICLASRTLSDAGCPVILPLSALTTHDWDFWYGVLQENPSTTYRC